MCGSLAHLAFAKWAVEEVQRLESWKVEKLSNLEDLGNFETAMLNEVQMGRVTACLLHNESASYCRWRQPKSL